MAEAARQAAQCAHEGLAMGRADLESKACEAKGRAAQLAADKAAQLEELVRSQEKVQQMRDRMLAASLPPPLPLRC